MEFALCSQILETIGYQLSLRLLRVVFPFCFEEISLGSFTIIPGFENLLNGLIVLDINDCVVSLNIWKLGFCEMACEN